MPLAPGLLSTTTGCFRAAPSRCAISRAMRSLPEPADVGTTMVMGRAGQLSDWAKATSPVANIATDAAVRLRALRRFMNVSLNSEKTVPDAQDPRPTNCGPAMPESFVHRDANALTIFFQVCKRNS